jgi:hypothetical protein
MLTVTITADKAGFLAHLDEIIDQKRRQPAKESSDAALLRLGHIEGLRRARRLIEQWEIVLHDDKHNKCDECCQVPGCERCGPCPEHDEDAAFELRACAGCGHNISDYAPGLTLCAACDDERTPGFNDAATGQADLDSLPGCLELDDQIDALVAALKQPGQKYPVGFMVKVRHKIPGVERVERESTMRLIGTRDDLDQPSLVFSARPLAGTQELDRRWITRIERVADDSPIRLNARPKP